jgi:hypothetical protein
MLMMVMAMAAATQACNYNPNALEVRSKPKLGYVIAQTADAGSEGRSYTGKIEGVPFKLHADICTTLTAEAVIRVPKDRQSQSVQLMTHLLDRLGIVLGGVHLTPAEQKTLRSTGELAVERGVTHRVYHYKVEPGGGVTISAVFSG